jgi:hypothetical protein
MLEIKKGDIFETTVVKAGGIKVQTKAFALPRVEPGVIVEYRWREGHANQLTHYVKLPLQREIPVRKLSYSVKPSEYVRGFRMVVSTFRSPVEAKQTETDGFTVLTLHDVPAFKTEPEMPPEDEVRGFMLVYYTAHATQAREAFWKEHGRKLHDAYKKRLAPDDSVRAEAVRLLAGATGPEDKLERLSRFCRSEVKHLYFNDGLTAEARERAAQKSNANAADTLARKLGTSHDIKVLFGALAAAAGFDVRVAASVDRSQIFFDEGFLDPYFMDQRLIVVRVGEDWRFYNPAASIATGLLPWEHEGLSVQSIRRRRALLRVDAEGGLEGDITIEAIGHTARRERARYATLSMEKRIETLTDEVKGRLPTIEVTDPAFEGLGHGDETFRLRYHVKVPQYAQRTGARLIFEPAFFEKGRAPRFTSATRRNPVYFPFAWTDEDDVRIEIPTGFEIENAEGVAPLSAGPVGGYAAKLGIQKVLAPAPGPCPTLPEGECMQVPLALAHHRRIWFGGEGHILFGAQQYAPIKAFFDAVEKADARTVVLKQAAR